MSESSEYYAWARKLVEASEGSPFAWGNAVAVVYQKMAAERFQKELLARFWHRQTVYRYSDWLDKWRV